MLSLPLRQLLNHISYNVSKEFFGTISLADNPRKSDIVQMPIRPEYPFLSLSSLPLSFNEYDASRTDLTYISNQNNTQYQ